MSVVCSSISVGGGGKGSLKFGISRNSVFGARGRGSYVSDDWGPVISSESGGGGRKLSIVWLSV